jgi:hypothetical protein
MKPRDLRLPALRRFAIAITIINLLGHTVLGFETSWAQMFVSLGTAYLVEIILEAVDAWANKRQPHFRGGFKVLVNFLMPAHITGLAISMLIYANDRLLPFVFAAAAGIASKAILTAPVGKSRRHFMNPSNFGILITVLLLPWIGVIVPYEFTENLTGPLDWALPVLIICTGSFLNARFTKRIPLVVSWLAAFFLQAVVRNFIFGTSITAGLMPMTGVAFLLFTFYMVPDPGTTPQRPRNQVIFGASVGLAYGLLLFFHLTYGLFVALLIVCAGRGLVLHAFARLRPAVAPAVPAPAPTAAPAHILAPTTLPAPAPAEAVLADSLE